MRLPLVRMPVAPGRSLAILVEVAARNQMLRARGLNAARDLVARLERALKEGGDVEADPGRGRRARGPRVTMARVKRAKAKRIARPPGARGTRRFVILTGLSGSGKTQAIRALEDLGYFCVDNLPTQLIPTMAELSTREDAAPTRSRSSSTCARAGSSRSSRASTGSCKAQRRVNPTLIFLEASHSALVRRFSETRRPHPLAPDRSVTEGIAEERQKLNAIRAHGGPRFSTRRT